MPAIRSVAAARLATLQRLLAMPVFGHRLIDVLLGLAALGGILTYAAVIVNMIAIDGGLAFDAHSYWLAGQRIFAGEELYRATAINSYDAYRYPPIFAQLWAPLALFPEHIFAWAWRAICLLSLRYVAGSWRNVGLWLLFAPTMLSLTEGNVTFPVMAASVFALRQRSGAIAGLWPAAAAKYGAGLLIPYLWLARRASRRPLLVGLATFAGACAISFVISPDAWFSYVDSLMSQAGGSNRAPGLISVFDSTTADFAFRLVIAAALVGIALRRGNDALAYLASCMVVPTLWPPRLSAALGVFALRPNASWHWRAWMGAGFVLIAASQTAPSVVIGAAMFGAGAVMVIGGTLREVPEEASDAA